MSVLDRKCCDVNPDSKNTQTVREFIHDMYMHIYHEDISDNALNEMSDEDVEQLADELDWLGWK